MGGSLSLCQLRRFRPYLICSKHTLPTASQACSLRLSGHSSSGPLSLRQGGAISASLRAALSRYPVRSNSRNWVGPYPFNRRFRPPCQLQAYVIPVLSFVMGGGSVKKITYPRNSCAPGILHRYQFFNVHCNIHTFDQFRLYLDNWDSFGAFFIYR